jgi:hypothetical protein
VAKDYSMSKGRRSSDRFFGIPSAVLEHPNWLLLTPHANKLIIDLGSYYYGTNNGDLCATWSMMQKRGWRSSETLNVKLQELRHYGFIVETQQGGLNRPTLYALTWKRIDKASPESVYKKGETPNIWRLIKPPFESQTTAQRAERKKKQGRLPNSTATATEVVRHKLTAVK